MKWEELPAALKRLVLNVLEQMRDHAGDLAGEEIGSGVRAAAARTAITAAIEKLREAP